MADLEYEEAPPPVTHGVTFEVTKNVAGIATVVFTSEDPALTHTRQVNVHGLDTNEINLRLAEVADGVAHKIAVGVITAAEEVVVTE